MNPIKLEIFLDDKTLAGMKSVEGNIAAMETVTKQVIEHLKLELKDLEKQYKVLQGQGLTGDKELADIQAMQGAIGGLKDQLKELQKAKQQTNETPIMSDDPAPKLNSVKMSMAQISRELPSLAMGPQMFFLAISNNIPMFTDAVGNARKEYERLTAAGQKATPVWKQVLSSLFSWQTVMSTAITLSVVFGKEIGNFISQLWKGGKAAISMAEAQEELNDAMMKSDSGVGKNLVSLKMLQSKWAALGSDLSAKKKFITENKDEFDKLNVAVGNVSDAENLLVDNTEAFIKAMQLRAKSAAAQKLAAEKYEESIKLQLEIDKEKKRPVSTLERVAGSTATVQSRGLINETGEDIKQNGIKYLEKQQKAADDAADAMFRLGEASEKEAQDVLKAANIKEKVKVKTPVKGGKTLTDYENELADARVRAQQKIEAARIAVMTDGYLKRKTIANKEYKEALAAIDKEERDTLAKMAKAQKAGKKITPEEEKQVKDAATSQRAVAMALYMQSSYDIEKEWRDKNQQAWIDYNKEYGTYQEKRLAITQDYALKIGRAETAGEKASLKKKRDEDLSDLYFNEINKNFNLADVFSNLDKQSTDALLVLRDKLKGYINGAAKQLRPSDLKELQNALAQMDVKLAERKPFQELKKSLSEYRQAQEALKTAQQDLNTVMAGGEVIIGFYTDETGKLIKKLLTQEQAEKKLSDASNRKSNAQQNMTTAFFSIQEHGGKLIQSGYQLADMFESLGLTIPDSFRDTLDGINQMISGLGGLKSEDMATRFSSIMSFITGLMSSLASMLNSFGDDKNSRLIDQLETINDIYQKILDKSKEDIVFGGGFAAIAAASSAMETLIKQTENYRKLARREGDKSDNNQGLGMLSKETISTLELAKGGYIQRISELLGKSFKGVEDLYGMSEEELALIRDKLPEAWALVDESIRKNLDSLADMKDEVLEIQTALNEALTGINQDSFYNEFIDNISDMDMSFEDMCSNFEGYLRKSILAGLVASQYKTRISDLYKQWSDAAKSDEKITKEESDALKEEYQNIIKDMIAERDSMADAFGWKGEDGGSSQSGRSGAYVAMTQEQGTKLEGLFTSVQDHLSGMHQLMEELKQERSADSKLFTKIAENTAYCKFLELMYEIMERQERDGFKLKG